MYLILKNIKIIFSLFDTFSVYKMLFVYLVCDFFPAAFFFLLIFSLLLLLSHNQYQVLLIEFFFRQSKRSICKQSLLRQTDKKVAFYRSHSISVYYTHPTSASHPTVSQKNYENTKLKGKIL